MSEDTLAGGAAADTSTPAPAAAPPAAVAASGAPPAAQPAAGAPPAAAPAADTGAPAAAAPAAPGAPLAAGGSTPDDQAKKVEAIWRDDWRQQIAGEDRAALAKLEKFDTPAALAKALAETEKKLETAGTKPALAKDATPEQVAEYRKALGIPEKADGYEIKPSNGYVFGEADAPALDSFRAFAHEHNWTPEQVQQGGEWYARMQEDVANQQAEADAGYKSQAEDTLRAQWGGDYRRNLAGISNFLATAPDGLADRLLGGRTADGKRIGDDPTFLQWLGSSARELNPMATVVPAGTANPGKAVAEEMADLRKMMGDTRSEYWKGPTAGKNQARYAELLKAQASQAGR